MADGRIVTADKHQNQDLFWAIRGGGGNFGVASSLEFRLHPVRQVLGGVITYPPSMLAGVLRYFAEYISEAPDELDALPEIANGPMQYAPGAASGALAIAVCHCGDLKAAETTLQPLRSFGPRQGDSVRAMPYVEMQSLADLKTPTGVAANGMTGYLKCGFIDGLSAGAIDAITNHISRARAPVWSFDLDHYLHGAVSRVDSGKTAFNLRHRGFSYRVFAAWKGAAMRPPQSNRRSRSRPRCSHSPAAGSISTTSPTKARLE
jgi:hypothetical protein